MAITSWVWGACLLMAIALPAGSAAWRLRRRFLADWHGAPARLAESVLAIGLIVAVAQAVGAVGGFTRLGLIAGVLIASVAATACARVGSVPSVAVPQESTVALGPPGTATWLAPLTAVAVVVGRWTTFTAVSVRSGVLASDSIWYHLPRAARFAQTGWVTPLHYTAPEFPDTFHPANAELVQAISMLAFQRDVLAGVINLGWLALLLLAAWCIGHPYGQGWLSLTGAAVVLATPLLVVEGAGNAGNDIAASFFLLAAVALLLQPNGGRAAVVVAGIAAGMAMSTKLTVVPAVAVLTLGVLLTGGPAGRARRCVAWLVPLTGFGAYWYVRNWLAVGSPIPATHLPLFPPASFRIADRVGFSVFDYLTDAGVWRHWFLPGLRDDFGLAFPLVIGLVVAAIVGALWKGGDGLVRSLGAVLLVGTVAYVMLPTTALGARGAPVLFAGNVVYLAPILLLAVAVVPVLCARDGSSSRRLLAAYLVVLVAGSLATPVSPWASGWLGRGIATGIVVWLVGAAVMTRHPGPRALVAVGALASAVLVIGLVGLTNDAGANRYAAQPLYRWATDVSHARIDIAGFAGQFPYYGLNLNNVVQYVGKVGPHGEYHDVTSCSLWRARLRLDGADYVVLRSERSAMDRRQLVWTRADPAARLLLHVDGGYVFAFDASVADPGCS